jgi:hypothetical protein
MALTTQGLTNQGRTTHYQIQYDNTLSVADGLQRAQALQSICEHDFQVVSNWFGNIALTVGTPITVNITPGPYASAGWGPPIRLTPGNGSSLTVVRYLLVAELSEMFMLAQNRGWFDPGGSNEGSSGEGLSRYLCHEFLMREGLGVHEPGFELAPQWLNSTRADFVNNVDVFDHGVDAKTGCAILFIYYLHTQLGYGTEAIIAAGAATLAGVHQNLTGDASDPFPLFKRFLDASFPSLTSSSVPGPNPDNPWPLSSVRVSPRLPLRSQVGVVSRNRDKLDVFATDRAGVIWTAAWEPAFADWWHGWWQLKGGRAAPGAPANGVSRSLDKLDVFVTGADMGIYTAAWEPAFTDWWHGWWLLNRGATAPKGHITVVSRNTDKLDAFVVGQDGRVYTAAWQPGFTDWWHGWWPIGNLLAPPGSPVHAVSRSPDKLDIFVTDRNGVIQSAAWEPAFSDGWHGWWPINGGRSSPGGAVTAVSRSRDKLDIFVVGTDGHIYSAAWEPSFANGWHGWWPIGSIRAPVGAPVHCVSRATDKLDIFLTDARGVTMTAAWQPSFPDWWHGWWELNGGRAAPGSPVTAVSRSTDKLDVFVVGNDQRIYTAAWEPSFTDGWHGWWPIGV